MIDVNTIEQHKKCYKKVRENLEKDIANIQRELDRINALLLRAKFYRIQISSAMKAKKERFDSDKYLVPKDKNIPAFVAKIDGSYYQNGLMFDLPKELDKDGQ